MSNPASSPRSGTALYQLPAELEAIHAELLENGGELTPELEARLEAVQGTLDVKVENTCRLIRELELAALAPEAEAKRLAERAKVRRLAAERLKSYLKRSLEALGIEKLKTATFEPRVQVNPWSVRLAPEIADPASLSVPETWLKPAAPRELDAKAVVLAWQQFQAAWDAAQEDGRVETVREALDRYDTLCDEFYRRYGFRCEEHLKNARAWPPGSDDLVPEILLVRDRIQEAQAALPDAWPSHIYVTRGTHLRL